MAVSKDKLFEAKYQKILIIFLGILVIIQCVIWMTEDKFPSCDSQSTMDKLTNIVKPKLVDNGFGDIGIAFSEGKEIASGEFVKSCEAVMTVSSDGEVMKLYREFDIRKKYDDNYDIVLYKIN